MIRRSFIFLPRIGIKKEESIWKQGILDWDSFLKYDIGGISKKSKLYYDRKIAEAATAIHDGKTDYFMSKMPSSENWRLYEEFRDETVFLDIETSSVTNRDSYITIIGLYDGIDTKTMVRGFNLDMGLLRKELNKYKLIVTFNGSSFDIPYLEKKYPGVIPNIPHIDLKHLCARKGFFGGLKEIEKRMGISRDNKIIEKIYGGDPLKLWKTYLATGDRYYLDLLVEYNEEDVINLKIILDKLLSPPLSF